MEDFMTLEQAKRIYPCGEREEILNMWGVITLLRYPDPATTDLSAPYASAPETTELSGANLDYQVVAEILMEAWAREARERDAAQAEAKALRAKLSEVESVKRYMAEQIARRLPDELRRSVTLLHDVLAKPIYDPMTGELAPAEADA